MKDMVADIQTNYENSHCNTGTTVREKVYQIDDKMVFDNINWNIYDISRMLNSYLEKMVKHANDMKWSDHKK